MPSTLHEVLIEMFRHRPSLAPELLTDALGIDVPAHASARLESGDFGDLAPTEYRADAVVVLTGGEAPVLAVVVEVQLRRDRDKRWSWPVYLTTLRARLRCPVVLLVVCVDSSAATWCAEPIELGPGSRVVPVVLGPDRVPVVTDGDRAAEVPELAVLSAMAHGSDPDVEQVLDALVEGLSNIDRERAGLYSDVVLAALPAAARRYLEALMSTGTWEWQSDYARGLVAEGRTEGRTEGEARALLAVLDARGVDVSDAARERITACTDLEQLDAWVRRAVTATSVDELFG
jgi:hypothetical protein